MPDLAIAPEPLAERSIDDRTQTEQLLAGVMHDIRSPLQVISLGTDLIAATAELPASAKLAISRMRGAMDRVVEMLDAVIHSSGKHTRPLNPLMRVTTVAELLDNAVAMMQPIAENKRITLRIEMDVHSGQLDVDYMGLMRVFSNLIGNAIKFSPSGSEIKVSAHREPACVRFKVVDQGPGIEARNLGRIFDRCWQANPKDGRGMGLGLALAKDIVELNGGSIGVSSVFGRGTELYFTVPAVEPVSEQMPAPIGFYGQSPSREASARQAGA